MFIIVSLYVVHMHRMHLQALLQCQHLPRFRITVVVLTAPVL